MCLIRINISEKSIVNEVLNPKHKKFGARGLVTSIVVDEVDPTCNALGPFNKFVLATGLMAGTNVSSSGRASVGTKSPLTGGIKESSSGGNLGADMGKLDIRAVVIEGYPQDKQWYYIFINEDGAKLLPANNLLNKGCYDTINKLKDVHGKKVSIMAIGQAGEQQMLAACISVTDREGEPTRQFARGGVGAVMGSKHIKAVVIDATNRKLRKSTNVEAAKDAVKVFHKGLMEHPVSGKSMPTYGTSALVNMANSVGALPVKNFSCGVSEHANKICGETFTEIINSRGGKTGHACMSGCVVRCSNVYVDEEGKEITGGFEYETISLLGTNICVHDLDQIAYLNRLCDDVGVDTIEFGVALGVAMDGGLLEYGYNDAVKVLKSIEEGGILGKVIGQGAKLTGIVSANIRVPQVKGQAMAAYDPRAVKGIGAIYAASPQGADHTAGPSISTLMKSDDDIQISLCKDEQVKTNAMENTGLCRFTSYAFLSDKEVFKSVLKLIELYSGIKLTEEEFWEIGRQLLDMELDFNKRAGLTKHDNRLPEFMYYEKLEPIGKVASVSNEEIEDILTNY